MADGRYALIAATIGRRTKVIVRHFRQGECSFGDGFELATKRIAWVHMRSLEECCLASFAILVMACAQVGTDDDPGDEREPAKAPYDASAPPIAYDASFAAPSVTPRPNPTPTPTPIQASPSSTPTPSPSPVGNLDPAVLLQGAIPKPGGLPGIILAGGDLSGAVPKPGGLPGVILSLAAADAGTATDAGTPADAGTP